jgi:hypothetical protein
VLARGDSFALFDRHGDLRPTATGRHGLFFDGTRFLSALRVRLARRRPLLLSSGTRGGNEGLSIHSTNSDVRDGDVLRLPRESVYLHRSIELLDGGCRMEFAVRSYASEPISVELEFGFAADFADLFEVRGARREKRGTVATPFVGRDFVELSYLGLDRVSRHTRLAFEPAPVALGPDFARFQLELVPGERSALSLVVDCELRGGEQRTRCGAFALPRAPRREPPSALFIGSSNPAFDAWIRRSAADLSMLTAETRSGPFPYAGVPWFGTPFGRDALIAAYSVLWLDPGLARGVLRFLAATQSTHNDPAEDAEPGKIVHEMRGGEMAALGEVPFARYYGSADATPLFLLLAAAYHDRTGDDDLLRELWPNFERALAWLDGPGDPDGDGFVEYQQRPRPVSRTRDGRTRTTRSHTPTARSRADRSRCARCRPTCTAPNSGSRARCGGSGMPPARKGSRKTPSACARASWTPSGAPSSTPTRSRSTGRSDPAACAARTQATLSSPASPRATTRRWSARRCSPTISSRAGAYGRSERPQALQPHVVPQRPGLAARQRSVAHGLATRFGAIASVNRILSVAFDASRHGDARLPEPCAVSPACPGRDHLSGRALGLVGCERVPPPQSVLVPSVDAQAPDPARRPALPSFVDWLVIREPAVDGNSTISCASAKATTSTRRVARRATWIWSSPCRADPCHEGDSDGLDEPQRQDLRGLRQRLRESIPRRDGRRHPRLRQLRVRDPDARADLRRLRHPHHRTRHRER